jgi:hypothetical protein
MYHGHQVPQKERLEGGVEPLNVADLLAPTTRVGVRLGPTGSSVASSITSFVVTTLFMDVNPFLAKDRILCSTGL